MNSCTADKERAAKKSANGSPMNCPPTEGKEDGAAAPNPAKLKAA